MLKKTEDKELVQAILNGNRSELKIFFDEYFPRIYRFAIDRVSGDHEAAREVVQNTLSKVFLNIHRFRGDSSLFTWMCSICNNETRDFLKKQSRYRKNIVLHGNLSDLDTPSSAVDDPGVEQPDDIYGRNQKTIMIHEALDRIPAKYSSAIEWKYIEGLSINQIAERLNIGHQAAQSMLFRARMAFQAAHSELSKTKF